MQFEELKKYSESINVRYFRDYDKLGPQIIAGFFLEALLNEFLRILNSPVKSGKKWNKEKRKTGYGKFRKNTRQLSSTNS